MSIPHRKTSIVILIVAFFLTAGSASAQRDRDSRSLYEIGYNHLGEQYLSKGVSELMPPGSPQMASEDLDSAREAFLAAIEMNPACVEARLNLARLYQLEGALDEAASQYEEVLRLSPRDINVLMDMALLQIEMDRTDRAVKYLNRAKKLTKDERQLQHLNRFVRAPEKENRGEPDILPVNSHSNR